MQRLGIKLLWRCVTLIITDLWKICCENWRWMVITQDHAQGGLQCLQCSTYGLQPNVILLFMPNIQNWEAINTTECTQLSLRLQDLYLRCIFSTEIILLPTVSGSLITAWDAASPDLRQRLWSPGISPNVNMRHNQGQPSMVHPPIWMVAGKLTPPHCKIFPSTEW